MAKWRARTHRRRSDRTSRDVGGSGDGPGCFACQQCRHVALAAPLDGRVELVGHLGVIDRPVHRAQEADRGVCRASGPASRDRAKAVFGDTAWAS
jgi:hypothetical protein